MVNMPDMAQFVKFGPESFGRGLEVCDGVKNKDESNSDGGELS